MTTKINIYCLIEIDGNFRGVYSSLRAAHRDALKICNKGTRNVLVEVNGRYQKADFPDVRSLFQGEMDKTVRYVAGRHGVYLIKTKLKT